MTIKKRASTQGVKKQFVELVDFLEENRNKKVSTILDEILLMTSSKKKDTTYVLDGEGNPFAIFCWYHKQWELIGKPTEDNPELVEFGPKKSTKTGLDTMCKIGVSKWSKAQREAKKANEQLLQDVAIGDVAPDQILAIQAEIEANRTTMDIEDIPPHIEEDELYKLVETFKVDSDPINS